MTSWISSLAQVADARREIGEKDRVWQVFAWRLERRFPERYARRSGARLNPPSEEERLVALGRMALDEIRRRGVNPTVPIPQVTVDQDGNHRIQ